MQQASMLTGSADCKASGPASHQGTTSRQVEARVLVSQLLNLHVVWTGFSLLVPNERGECLTVVCLMYTGPVGR